MKETTRIADFPLPPESPLNRPERTQKRLFSGCIFSCLILAFLTPPIFAQSGAIPPEKVEAIITSVLEELDEPSSMAQDYYDILVRLQDLLDDYNAYLLELPDSSRKKHQLSFRQVRQRLADDTYAEKPSQLSSDLSAFAKQLDSMEQAHRAGSAASARCCSMVRNLRRELLIVAELASEHQAGRSSSPDLKSAARHLRAALDSLRSNGRLVSLSAELLSKLDRLSAQNADLARLSADIAKLSTAGTPARVVIKRLDEVTSEADAAAPVARAVIATVPSHPNPPTPPAYAPLPSVPAWQPAKNRSPGHRRHISASQLRTVKGSPLRIELPAGNLAVTGSRSQSIEATFEYGINAPPGHVPSSVGVGISLAISSDAKQYLLQVELPSALISGGQLLEGQLTVSVPADLALQIVHHNGSAVIAQCGSDIRYEGQMASVSLQEIEGDVYARTTMGAVHASRINGSQTLSTSFHPILINDVTGDVSVTNQYAETIVSRMTGNLAIAGTGKIAITDQVGDLKITNAYGQVIVRNVQGSVAIANAFGDLDVADITGSADLANSYARISAGNIHGHLSAKNLFGLIEARDQAGTVDLINSNGTIRLSVREAAGVAGRIESHSGDVSLMLDEQTNLLLQAQTSGELECAFPVSISSQGSEQSLRLALGSAHQALTVRGNQSNIFVTRLGRKP